MRKPFWEGLYCSVAYDDKNRKQASPTGGAGIKSTLWIFSRITKAAMWERLFLLLLQKLVHKNRRSTRISIRYKANTSAKRQKHIKKIPVTNITTLLKGIKTKTEAKQSQQTPRRFSKCVSMGTSHMLTMWWQWLQKNCGHLGKQLDNSYWAKYATMWPSNPTSEYLP